jgi:hypothetical protein
MTLPKGIKYCVFLFFMFLFCSGNIFSQAADAYLKAQKQTQKKSDTDSLRILTWKLNMQSLQYDTIPVDTAINFFQFYNPVFKWGISQTYLGNLGLPAITNTFTERTFTTPFIFMQALEPYMLTPEKNIFYNTHRPYTNLMYTTSGGSTNSEESMHVIHTQNITPKWNVGINFTIFASKGLYPAQRTKDRVFTVHTNYQGKYYKLLASYHLNKFTNQENGGLTNDTSVNLKNQDFLPVNLYNAKNRYASNTFFLLQSFQFGGPSIEGKKDSAIRKFVFPASTVSLLIRYDRTRKTFEDLSLKTPNIAGNSTLDSAYFNHFYFSQFKGSDSAICRKFTASLRYTLKESDKQKVPIGLSFMLVQELFTYGYYNQYLDQLPTFILFPVPDSISHYNNQSYTHNHFNLKGGMSLSRSESKRFKLVATAYLTLLGYEIGNYWLNGNLDMNFPLKSENKLHLAATLRADRPDFFYTAFASNFKMWDNTLKNTFRNEVEASYSLLHDYSLEAHLINMNEYVYFNDAGYPDQTSKNLVVMSGSLSKTFSVWKFVSINKVLVQYSSNQLVLPLPAASVYLSNFLDFQPVRNVLYAQFGFDIFYHSQYYGYAYDPVTGSFHTQHDKMTGNYPFLDAFLNLKLKRTRFYFKYEHADFGWLSRDYFNSLHYPMPRGSFRFGLSWAFYD